MALKNSTFHLSPAGKRELVAQYIGLVKSVAKTIASKNVKSSILSFDDLVQYGMIGLLDAFDRYDPHKGAKFETFAIYRIRGAILDGLRSADVLSRRQRKEVKDSYALEHEAAQRAMSFLHMNSEDYHHFIQEIEGESMKTTRQADVITVLEDIPDEESNSPFEIVSQESMNKKLVGGLQRLPEKERLILTLYYYEDLTFKEIGQVLHLSESRVFQLHAEAILSLRTLFVENGVTA
ncbi:MAG: FliA/WhiG family RNA polymerase sigma factor [Bacteroidetes bacterium]|nr:FliA/WhiG family RNA polymerase sigma factor [Bacteroidota bacterium]